MLPYSLNNITIYEVSIGVFLIFVTAVAAVEAL